ncbi:Uncharacterised protein r2_g3541 [Pycnogonum litorale]
MPFGLRNSPITFSRLMNIVLPEALRHNVFIYLDDIIFVHSNLEDHLEAFDYVLRSLKEANLTVNLNKCQFLQEKLGILGHDITARGIEPNSSKIKSITNFPPPHDRKIARACSWDDQVV